MVASLITGTRGVVIIDPATGQPGGIVVEPPAGGATEAKQDAIVAALGPIASETTLAAILAKLIAAPATEATLAGILAKLIAAPATEAKQDALKAVAGALDAAKELDPDAASASIASLLRGILDCVFPGQQAATSSISVVLATDDPAVASLAVVDDWDEADRAKVNVIAGQAGISAAAGAVAANTPRMTLASDDPAVASLAVVDDWDEADRAKVNVIAGQAGISAAAGAVAANTPRMTLASDDPLIARTPSLGAVTAAAPASVNSSAASQTILAANAARKGVTIVNTDAHELYLRFGATAATTALGGFNVIVPANGGEYVMDQPIYTGEIRGIWAAAGSGGAAITEFA